MQRADIDRIANSWQDMLTAAAEMHARHGHCGEMFDSCPFFPCNVVRDVAQELLREYVKCNNLKPKLVTPLDMCAVAEMLK